MQTNLSQKFPLVLHHPVARVLASPLTMPMLRATDATLADSIRHHVTAANLLALLAILAAGAMAPVALTWRARRAILVPNVPTTLRARVLAPLERRGLNGATYTAVFRKGAA